MRDIFKFARLDFDGGAVLESADFGVYRCFTKFMLLLHDRYLTAFKMHVLNMQLMKSPCTGWCRDFSALRSEFPNDFFISIADRTCTQMDKRVISCVFRV